MCADLGPDRLRFAGLIPERVQKSENNIQPTIRCGKVLASGTKTFLLGGVQGAPNANLGMSRKLL